MDRIPAVPLVPVPAGQDFRIYRMDRIHLVLSPMQLPSVSEGIGIG